MNGIVLVGALLLAICCTGNNSVFLEQPNSGQLFSPIGKLLVLNCTVSEGFVQTWSVTLPNISTPATSDSRRGVILLNDHGIYVQENSQMMSQLIFNRTSPIEVMLMCIATPTGSSDETPGNQVSIIIYGPPPTLTNLTSIENGPGSLNITWKLEFFEEVAIDFMLTVINLGTSTQQMFTTQEQHFTIRVKDATSCDVYNFTVRAMADSGSSPPSEVITRSIPCIPDIALIASSATHFLVRMESSRFTLSIRIQDMNTCLDYPVLSYTVVLENADGTMLGEVMNNSNIITITDLAEDTLYAYYIRAENKFGSSDISARVHLMTTDVQDVNICQIRNSRNYQIQCIYVERSDARGCVYNILSDGENVTGTIAKSSTEEVMVELTSVTSNDKVIVRDWERSGSIGILSISVNLSSVVDCLVTTTINESTDNGAGLWLPIMLGFVAALAIIVVIVIMAILWCHINRKKKYTMSSKDGMQKFRGVEVNTLKDYTKSTLNASKITTTHVSAVLDTRNEVDGKVEPAIKKVDEDPMYNEVLSVPVKPPDLITSKTVVVSSHSECKQHDVISADSKSAAVSSSADPVYSMVTPEEPASHPIVDPEFETNALDEGPLYSIPEQATPDGNTGSALKSEKVEEYTEIAVSRKKKREEKSKKNKLPPFLAKAPPYKSTLNVGPESEMTEGPLYSTPGEATTDAKSGAASKVEEYSDVVVSAPQRKKKAKDKSKSNKPPQFLVKAPPYKASPTRQTGATQCVVENDNSTYSEVSSQPKRSRGKNPKKAVGVVKTSQFKASLNLQMANSAPVEDDGTYSTVADQKKQVQGKGAAKLPPDEASTTGVSSTVEDDGMYSTVFNGSKKMADQHPDEYATLNLDTVNQDLEQQNEAQPDSDVEAPPPVPAYCPSGGDSPC